MCLQVFQLAALATSDPADLPDKFSVCLNGVQIAHREIEGAIACVQNSVRGSLFTQFNFMSETGISMPRRAVFFRQGSAFHPWGLSGVCAGSIISELQASREKVKVAPRRKTSQESRERWFDVDTVVSFLFGEGTARAGVQISNVVEVGDEQNLDSSQDAGLPNTSRFPCSLAKGMKRHSSAGPFLKKKKFSFASPAPAHTSFEAVLEKNFAESGARRSDRDRRNAPVFQGYTKKNNLFVCSFVYFSHL